MSSNQKIKFTVLYLVAIVAGVIAGTNIFDAIAF